MSRSNHRSRRLVEVSWLEQGHLSAGQGPARDGARVILIGWTTIPA